MSNKIILIVEDDKDIRDNLYELLELEGYSVRTAANGKVALEILDNSQHLPNLIFLDLMMPIMDGRTFLAKMREVSEFKSIPVVVISAAREEIQEEIAEFMKKPLDLDQVLIASAKYNNQ